MKFLIGALAGLFCLFTVPAAFAQIRVVPSAFVAACGSDQETEYAKCAALLRGSAERLQTILPKGKAACREKPFAMDDVKDFVKFASSHMIPDSGEGSALAANFWLGNLANVPCADVPGYWSVGHLLSLCSGDHGPGSACSLYWSGALMIVNIEGAAGASPAFCPKGNTIRSQDEVYRAFGSWAGTNPKRADQPAALGFIEALKAAYPC